MNRKQQSIFDAVFSKPPKANIEFADLEKLTVALGGKIIKGSGSRTAFSLNGKKLFAPRPHPEKAIRVNNLTACTG